MFTHICSINVLIIIFFGSCPYYSLSSSYICINVQLQTLLINIFVHLKHSKFVVALKNTSRERNKMHLSRLELIESLQFDTISFSDVCSNVRIRFLGVVLIR